MVRRIFNIMTLVAVLFFVVLVLLAAPSFFDPEFEIENKSNGYVSVVAEWRNKEMDIGNIAPMSSSEFSINDESAMKFRIRYPGGREVESEPIYFTSGVKVIATITNDSVEVRYDHEI